MTTPPTHGMAARAGAHVGRTPVRGGRAIRLGLLMAGLGLAGWLLALWADPESALRAWLTAWTYGVSVTLGCLCLVMIAHVTGARWFVVVRRIAEAAALSVSLLALGLVPVLLDLEAIYPWAGPMERMAPAVRSKVLDVQPWLDPGFFRLRAILYVVVWAGLATILWRASVATDPRPVGSAHRDDEGRASVSGGAVAWSAVGLILFGFTLTFAAFDWIMSLTPEWHSTVFGIYWFTGSMVAALSTLILVARGLESAGYLRRVVAAAHYHALGRLLLTFVILWAYAAYSQGFLMWIADVPAEIDWYLARSERGWGWVFLLLGIAHFVVPFLALLSRGLKRRPRLLSAVAVWLLVAHWIDLYWLMGPAADGGSWLPSWSQIPALAAVLGLGGACAAALLDGRPPVPAGDSGFHAALEYESS